MHHDSSAVSDRSIHDILVHLRRRQRLQNMLRCAIHGTLLGAMASAAAVAMMWAGTYFEWFGVPTAGPLWAVVAIPATMLLGIAIGAAQRIDDLAVARELDRCAQSQDRFASALVLAANRHADRVRLITADAMAHVGHLPATKVIPLEAPRSTRWVLVPVAVLLLLLIAAPQPQSKAATPVQAEISDDQWSQLQHEFEEELAQLPKPETEAERALRDEFKKLAAMLEEKPAKREALREIARLSDRVEQHRRTLGTRDINMRKAAQAMARSEALKKLASLLKQGQYTKAATELTAMADQLSQDNAAPDAQQFEAMAADMERLAEQLSSHQDLQDSCQQCANAANSMNRESLAEAMRRLAEQLEKNADQMQQCDSCNQQQNLLEQLKRRMNQCSQCKGCEGGCSQCQGGLCQKPGGSGAKKGGLKAGWGSAAKWDDGQLGENEANHTAELSNPIERNGEQSSFRIVSPDERAESSMSYEEMYAEFVQKAEADLDLESVPIAQREFLRRYFNAIRPQDNTADGAGE